MVGEPKKKRIKTKAITHRTRRERNGEKVRGRLRKEGRRKEGKKGRKGEGEEERRKERKREKERV